MKRFEAGMCYEAADRNYEPIKVLKRTGCFVFVEGLSNGVKWRMKIRNGANCEYAVDSSVPPKWRDIFTYRADALYE